MERPGVALKAMNSRRFPPPRSIDELEACFVVAGQKLAYVYFGDPAAAKPLTPDEARRIAAILRCRDAIVQ